RCLPSGWSDPTASPARRDRASLLASLGALPHVLPHAFQSVAQVQRPDVLAVGPGGEAGPRLAGRYVLRHAAAPGHARPVADPDVIRDRHVAADDHAVADDRAATYRGRACHQAVAADADVVPDL